MVRRGSRPAASRSSRTRALRQAQIARNVYRSPSPATDPPLPPAPLLKGPELLLLGSAAALQLAYEPVLDTVEAVAAKVRELASQVWGYFSSRPPTKVPAPLPSGAAPLTGTVPPAGNTVGGTLTYGRSSGTAAFFTENFYGVCNPLFTQPIGASTSTENNVTKVEYVIEEEPCGVGYMQLELTLTNGSVVRRDIGGAGSSAGFQANYTLSVSWNGPGAVPYESTLSVSLPDGYQAQGPEEIEQLRAPEASSLPVGAPLPIGVAVQAPAGDAVTQPSSATAAAPNPWPAYSPALTPSLASPYSTSGAAGGQTQTTVDTLTSAGTLPAPAAAPIPTTDPSKSFYGGAGFGGGGSNPQPTLQGIAGELGRIENKLGAMLDPTPNTAPEWWQLLRDVGVPLIQALFNTTDSGEYTLTDVCPPCGEEPVEYPFEWGGSPFALANTNSRIDALALMLQKQKELKQPLCKPCVIGQPVQVQFIQSELEWEPPP